MILSTPSNYFNMKPIFNLKYKFLQYEIDVVRGKVNCDS